MFLYQFGFISIVEDTPAGKRQAERYTTKKKNYIMFKSRWRKTWLGEV